MFTNYILIQKLESDGNFTQYFSNQGQLVWRFLERKQLNYDNQNIFPFEIDGNIVFNEVKKGRETSLIVDKEKRTFTFKENYSVPSGFIIAVVLPKNYVPISFNFGVKAFIPMGEVKPCPPGYIEVFYNKIENLCSVVFTITNQANFQFSCCGHYSYAEFPSSLNNYLGSVLGATIRANDIGAEAITCEQLKVFSTYFKNETDLSEIAKALNELKTIVMENHIDTTKEERIKHQIGQSLSNTVSVAGSIVTLVDSYLSGNSVAKFISAIILSLKG